MRTKRRIGRKNDSKSTEEDRGESDSKGRGVKLVR